MAITWPIWKLHSPDYNDTYRMMMTMMMMMIMRMMMRMRMRGMVMKSLYRKVVEEKSGLTVGFRASPLPSRKLPRVSESALCTLY